MYRSIVWHGIMPVSESNLDIILLCRECEAHLIGVGHRHRPLHQRIGAWHVVNLGSGSNPPPAARGTRYVILHADETGYYLEHRLVEDDGEAVVRVLERQ